MKSTGVEPPALMVVYVTYNLAEAHIVAGRLQSEGIGALVHQEPAGSAIGITFGPLGEIKVLVEAPDYDAALALLEDDAYDTLPADTDQIIFDDEEFDDDDTQ